MKMEECALCRALERHLKTIGMEFLCATQQRGIDRSVVNTLREQLHDAEARIDRHRMNHQVTAAVMRG